MIMNTIKRNFIALILRSKILIISILLLSSTSCHSQANQYQQLKDYLHTISDTLNINKYKSIFYVSENGCPTCVKSFSQVVQQYVFEADSALIIVNAKGRVVNVENYRNNNVSNVIYDYTSNFYRLRIASTSCVITLKNNAIDTVIAMDVYKLKEQLDAIPQIVK